MVTVAMAIFWVFLVIFAAMTLYGLALLYMDDYDWEQFTLVGLFGMFVTFMFYSIGKFIGWAINSINAKELQEVGFVHFIGIIMLILLLRGSKERNANV